MTTRHWLPGGRALLAAALLAGASLLPADELPLDTQEKLLREQAVDAVMRNDVSALFEAMDEFRALEGRGVTVPAGLYFAEADSARSSGHPVRAERAFNDYFRVSPAEGAAFAEAMRAYGEFRQAIPEATWPILERMKPVPAGVLRTGLTQREVRVTPFSLSQQQVTRGQFAAFVAATDHRRQVDDAPGECRDDSADGTEATDGSASEPVTCVSWRDAAAYVAWLNGHSGLRFRLPSAEQWQYAMQGLESAAPPTGPGREWVSDCATAPPSARGSAAAAFEASCRKRTAVSTGAREPSPTLPADRRSILDDGYRAPDLGFRLAIDD